MASLAESLLAPVRGAAHRAGLVEVLRWWRSELVALVPAGWRERFDTRGVSFVSAEGDEWRLLRPAADGLAEAGRARLGPLDAAARRAGLRRLVGAAPGDAANAWLVLAPGEVLVREAVMPLAAEEALRDAVGFELDRLTPFTAEHACFDVRVTGRDAAAQRLTLQLAAAPRSPVAARLAELREMGATVLGVGVPGDLGLASAPFNLLAPEERDRPAVSRATMVARALAGVAAVLAAVALVYPLWQKREAVIALQPRLERAKAGAEVADRLAREIERLAAEHNYVLARKQGQHPAVLLVEDLSRLLPDTTWVQQLDIKAGPKVRELQLAGETGSSSQLIEVLEKSGSLANASFKSPLTKGVTPNTERFLVAAEVKPRPLPEPRPEASLVVAPPAPAAAPVPAAPPAQAAPAPAPPAGEAPKAGAAAPKAAPPATAPAQPAATLPPAAPQPASPAPSAAKPAPKA